ncbi:hypothetical protein Tco_1294795 [Tanacetum coccineum]
MVGVQNVGNQVNQHAVQNLGIQNVGNQNGLIVVPGITNQNTNQNGIGNVVAARAEGNGNGNNGNQTQLLIAQKEEAGIQLQAEEFDLMAAAGDIDEIEEVNANCILMANLQQASTSGIQTDKAPIYDSDGLAENDSNVIPVMPSVEQSGGTVEQNLASAEETRALYDSLYNNLAIEVEKVNSVNHKMKETNAELTTELARHKTQKQCFEINQEKYDKLERCYQKSVYQEQCLTKKINALHLSSAQQKQQSLYNGKVLLEKHDPPVVYDSEETLQLAQESRLKMKQLNKEIKPANYAKINQLSEVFVSQKAMSREESYFSNTFKMASVSKTISLPNEEFSDDTSPSVARKFLNEEEIYPIVNQVDARVQNFEIQFLKEAAKFVQDFKSLANEADESLAKQKALELEIERLLQVVVSQDIMSIVQNPTVVESSDLQTELEPYNDMQQKIERLQAQLGDLKGKSKDTSCVSYTLEHLSQKLENENVELEFQVSEQKDTIKGTSTSTKFTKQSILGKPPSSSKLKLYSVTPFPNSKVLPKVDKSNALSNPVTSNSIPSTSESNVVKNDNVIAPRMFRINFFKTSRVDKFVPINKVRASVRTNLITVSQPHVISKENVNFNSNGISSTGVDNTDMSHHA